MFVYFLYTYCLFIFEIDSYYILSHIYKNVCLFLRSAAIEFQIMYINNVFLQIASVIFIVTQPCHNDQDV